MTLVQKEIKKVSIWKQNVTDMRGPCKKDFHIPLHSEIVGLNTIMKSLGLTTGDDWRIKLHMPFAGYRNGFNSNLENVGTTGDYWTSTGVDTTVPFNYCSSMFSIYNSDRIINGNDNRCHAKSIRPFKDSYVEPDSSWTVIQGTLGSAGIFWDQTNGLISITGDGTTGYTIADKNNNANTVYNDGDTLNADNCGYYYQWGNNYGFSFNGVSTTSSTQVNASPYGPGYYYIGSTFVFGTNNSGRDSSNNSNLRGGDILNILKEYKIYPIQAGIYHNATLGLISLSSDGENWITISDKNLGATTVYNDGDTLSEANCGKLYQWGNNYGFPYGGTVTTSQSQVNASTYGPNNYYSSSTFIIRNSDWSSSKNDNLRGDTTNTLIARKGPCNTGYHIMSASDCCNICNIMNSLGLLGSPLISRNQFKIYLKIPTCNTRAVYTGDMYSESDPVLWTSSPINTFVYNFKIYNNNPTILTSNRSSGLPIRPIKNEAVIPDSSWTVLYQR